MSDAGVSPVVGTVLLLAIMLTTVAALIGWGIPALQDMERLSTHRSVRSAFGVLDGVVDEVLPEIGSSRTARIPVSNGGITTDPTGEPFAVAWSFTAGEVTFEGLEDGDTDVTFDTSLSVDECRFTHFHRNGSKDTSETVSPSGGGDTCSATQDLDKTHELVLHDTGSGEDRAVLWIFHAGRVRFTSTGPQTPFHVDYHNGAVSTDFDVDPWLVNDPLILKLDPEGLAIGLIDLNGTAQAAGGESLARAQVTLDASLVRADAQTARRADLYPLGDMGDGWRRYLATTPRYDLDRPSGTDLARYDPGTSFPVTLTHYVVDVSVEGIV